MYKKIETLKKKYPDSFGKPIKLDGLNHFMNMLYDAGVPLPDISFWKTYFLWDGFSFNGLELFSVMPAAVTERGYTLPDLLERNTFYHDYYSDYEGISAHYFFIGCSDEDILVFDIVTKQYAALAREDLMVYETHDNLWDLISHYL